MRWIGLMCALALWSVADARAAGMVPSPNDGTRAGLLVQVATCTQASPCTGPRGGSYYTTRSGKKRYIKRH